MSGKEIKFLITAVLVCACLPMLTREKFPPQPKADAVSTHELYGAIELQRLVRERPQQKQFTVVWPVTHNGGKGWSVLKFDAPQNSLRYKPFRNWPEGWHFVPAIPPVRKFYRPASYRLYNPDEFRCNKVTSQMVKTRGAISGGDLLYDAGCNVGTLMIT